MSNNKYKIAAGAGLAFLILSRSWVQMVLGFFILMFVGHIIWQNIPNRFNVNNTDNTPYYPTKSTKLIPNVIPDVGEFDKIKFQFNGYDLYICRVTAEWLESGGLDKLPDTELAYLAKSGCKKGFSGSCDNARRQRSRPW